MSEHELFIMMVQTMLLARATREWGEYASMTPEQRAKADKPIGEDKIAWVLSLAMVESEPDLKEAGMPHEAAEEYIRYQLAPEKDREKLRPSWL